MHPIFTTQHSLSLSLLSRSKGLVILEWFMASTGMLSLMLAMVLVSTWVLPGMSRDLPNQLISEVISYANPAMALSKVVMVHSAEAKKLLTCVGLNESCGPAYWCCDTNTCQFSVSEFRFRCISCGPTELCLEWLLSGSTSPSPGIFLIYVSCSYLNVCNKGCIALQPLGL